MHDSSVFKIYNYIISTELRRANPYVRNFCAHRQTIKSWVFTPLNKNGMLD